MVIEIILGIIIIIALVEGYVVFNLTKKTEMLETWIEEYSGTIQKVQDQITSIDYKGYFEADDEVGTIWTEIKNSADELSKFVEPIENENEKEDK